MVDRARPARMEDVQGKARSVVTCGARSVAKASETVAAAEVVCHAPNKMSFFEQLGGCQRLGETGSGLAPAPAPQRRSFKASVRPQLNR